MAHKFLSSPCVSWIKRGVSKAIPTQIALDKEELKELLDQNGVGKKIAEGDEDSDDELTEDEDATETDNLRQDDLAEYELDDYDRDDVQEYSALRGLTYYTSNDADPDMLEDEDDDSDIEDYKIRPDDNLVAIGHANKNIFSIQLFVYSEKDDDFFIHHDISLPNLPLCLEWLGYDTENSNLGNYLAVGSLSPEIEIWDVDIVDSFEPAFLLGRSKKKHKKKAHKESNNVHTDAVLSLAWNSHIQQVLVSGSADCTAIIWDMSCGRGLHSLKNFSDKVQCLKWHPFETQYLLTGSCDKLATLIDCRDPEQVAKTWKCSGEVEHVLWNHFSPYHCLASTDQGFVHCYDARGNSEALWTLSAHTDSCTGFTLSSQCPGLMVTASFDESIKVWDIVDQKPSFVHEIKAEIGKIFCIAASPDSPFIVSAGGYHKNRSFKLVDLMKFSSVKSRFQNRQLLVPSFNKEDDSQLLVETAAREEASASTTSLENDLNKAGTDCNIKKDRKKKKIKAK